MPLPLPLVEAAAFDVVEATLEALDRDAVLALLDLTLSSALFCEMSQWEIKFNPFV